MISTRLQELFALVGKCLVRLAPGCPAESCDPPPEPPPLIASYYSEKLPVLRLVFGLCEGADSLAFRALESLQLDHLTKDFAAVIPFDISSYRDSRAEDFLAEFDREASACSYIMVPDGIHGRSEVGVSSRDAPLPKRRRSRGYRCQSALLLRQSDVLVAVVDPDTEGRAGGTLEAVRSAHEFGLPVIVIRPQDADVILIAPEDDFLAAASREGDGQRRPWNQIAEEWVTAIVADPLAGREQSAEHGFELLDEYFDGQGTPPTGGVRRLKALALSWLWTRIERQFEPRASHGPPAGIQGEPPERSSVYNAWRNRGARLSTYYSGLYRGTYLLNYLLAVMAVLLAALCLVLLGQAEVSSAPSHDKEPVAASVSPASHEAPAGPDVPPEHGHGASHWLHPALLVLGTLKLCTVVGIYTNTRKVRKGNWNDKTVDYRYLAERLRALFHLPLAGSFQPPAPARRHYAARSIRQTAVEWLFGAILRSPSPADQARVAEIPVEAGKTLAVRLLHLDPLAATRSVEMDWIPGQAGYHQRNALVMHRMAEGLERWGGLLSAAVIVAVAVDIAIVVSEICGTGETGTLGTSLQLSSYVLVFLAAVLPATVAALNGIRFQSECERLAERSSVMHAILIDPEPVTGAPGPNGRLHQARHLGKVIQQARSMVDTDPGSWALDALNLSEAVAADFVHEVAEWSVLYAKELPEA